MIDDSYDWVETDYELFNRVTVEYFNNASSCAPTDISFLPVDSKGIFYQYSNGNKSYLNDVKEGKIIVQYNDTSNIWIIVQNSEVLKYNTQFYRKCNYDIIQAIPNANKLYLLLANNSIIELSETSQSTFISAPFPLFKSSKILAIHIFSKYLCTINQDFVFSVYELKTRQTAYTTNLSELIYADFPVKSIESIKFASISNNDFHYLTLGVNVETNDGKIDSYVINGIYHYKYLNLFETKKISNVKILSIHPSRSYFVVNVKDDEYIITKAFNLEGRDIGRIARYQENMKFISKDVAISESNHLVQLLPSMRRNNQQISDALNIVSEIVNCYPEDVINDAKAAFFRAEFPVSELRKCDKVANLLYKFDYNLYEIVYKGICKFVEQVSVDKPCNKAIFSTTELPGVFDKAFSPYAFSILEIAFDFHAFIQAACCSPSEASLNFLGKVGDILHPIVYNYVTFINIMSSPVIEGFVFHPSKFVPDKFPALFKQEIRFVITKLGEGKTPQTSYLSQKNKAEYIKMLICPTTEQKLLLTNLEE
ncbi:hypothetical protein TVAG_150150 [Trichomonas vaginalis G3]|uniref:Uncharacterized protein n=1 Tax=Trichomonas vaginalis (strain ATCC PRA-98 / G3) TaxID=412133 RepID=A2DRR7_TRIV3|nr:hypothetical protein TVAGG3_0979050 [Trichomonas vaginalis G3]EAY16864.1 hypothetical protein TVAG_150150 [Trichomonas vaginalis G3]KAI5489149.1 hypothetical protein TVAGG3_0979050 [Trichomonas vaginalis G3]|eukprot:XP_001329087.1 hypothetical protein [Trichomonas vaginalis G3]